MDVDLEDENEMNILMIDSILELWETKNLNGILENDFADVKKKIKSRVDSLINSIRNLECSYLDHVQGLETVYRGKHSVLKAEIEKLSSLKNGYKKEKTSQAKEKDINVKDIEALSEKIRSLAQNKIEFIANQKFQVDIQSIGKLINPVNKYDDKRLNAFQSSNPSPNANKLLPSNQLTASTSSNSINNDRENDLILINQEVQRKININNLFTKPVNLCNSNNRFSGALLIPEHKYSKLSSLIKSATSSAFYSEYILVSVANRNCLKLISVPEGRIIRTFQSFPSKGSRTDLQKLKEPRCLCWNYDKSLIIVCDSGNNRIVVLRPNFLDPIDRTGSVNFKLNIEFEFLFEISDLTDLNVNPAVNHANLVEMNRLQYPASVCCAYDYNGDVYISDTFNNRIVCLNKELTMIKTILFGGYNNPFSICLWKQKLIIADTYNNRILIVSIVDGEHEKTIPKAKRYGQDDYDDDDDVVIDNEDEDEDDDDSLDCRDIKRKRLSSSSSSSSENNLMETIMSTESANSTSSSDDDDDDDEDDYEDEDKKSKKKREYMRKLRLKPGRFKRPYSVCTDGNDRLYVLDWYKTDTKSHEESMRLSGRVQTFDLENDLQLLNYTKANNQLHLPNTMLILKNGGFVVCNVRHLTLFSQNDYFKFKMFKRRQKIRWRNVNNYSDDDDVIILPNP